VNSTDARLHYRHPPAGAFRLNKLLYRVRMDEGVRRRFMEDPEAVMAEYGLSPQETQAARALEVDALTKLGAHPLLAFMARFNVEHDRRGQS
jgi:hypothetical protein